MTDASIGLDEDAVGPLEFRTYILTPTGDLRRLVRGSRQGSIAPKRAPSSRPSYVASERARRADQRVKWLVVAVWTVAVAIAAYLALAAADVAPFDVSGLLT